MLVEEESLFVNSGGEQAQVVTRKANREDAKSTLVKSMRETKKKWKMFLILNIIGWPLQVLFAYLIVSIEGKYENEAIKSFRVKEKEFVIELQEFGKKFNISQSIIQELLAKSNELVKTDPGEEKWTMLGAMGFLAETGTTVGYGTITPQTDEGKLLTVFIIFVMVPLVGFVCGVFGTGIQTLANLFLQSSVPVPVPVPIPVKFI